MNLHLRSMELQKYSIDIGNEYFRLLAKQVHFETFLDLKRVKEVVGNIDYQNKIRVHHLIAKNLVENRKPFKHMLNLIQIVDEMRLQKMKGTEETREEIYEIVREKRENGTMSFADVRKSSNFS